MPTKGKHYYFTCNTWLARDKGDGKTSKTFMIQDGQSSVVSYKPSESQYGVDQFAPWISHQGFYVFTLPSVSIFITFGSEGPTFFGCQSWQMKAWMKYFPVVPYEATFITGDVKDAGTDAEITMRVFGENGTTSDIKLDKASDRFERARNDFIKVRIQEMWQSVNKKCNV